MTGMGHDELRRLKARIDTLAREAAETSEAIDGDLEQAATLYGRAHTLADRVLAEDAGNPVTLLATAQLRYRFAAVELLRMRPAAAITLLDSAEALYASPLVADGTQLQRSDLQIRRAIAYADRGATASAVLDVQRAVMTMRELVEPTRIDVPSAHLGRLLATASRLLCTHTSTLMALAAVSEATDSLIRAIAVEVPPGELLRPFLTMSLVAQTSLCRLVGLDEAAELTATELGDDRHLPEVAEQLAANPYRYRAGLHEVAREHAGSDQVAATLARLMDDPPTPVTVPAELVEPEHLFAAATGAGPFVSTALAGRPDDAAVAGLDVLAMFTHAHEAGLAEQLTWEDRRVGYVEWARLATELALLAAEDPDGGALAHDHRRQAERAAQLAASGSLSAAEREVLEWSADRLSQLPAPPPGERSLGGSDTWR